MEFIYKKLCIYSQMFKLHSPSKYSPFDAIHLLRHFFHYSKQFLNSSILMPFKCSRHFLFSLLPHQQTFHFEDFCHPGKQKKVTWDEILWIGSVEHGGHAVFGQKLLNTQHSVGKCARKSPIMKWANTLKESSKKIHWALASIAQWVECHRTKPKVTSSVPGQGTCLGCEPSVQMGYVWGIDISCSDVSLPPFPSLQE